MREPGTLSASDAMRDEADVRSEFAHRTFASTGLVVEFP